MSDNFQVDNFTELDEIRDGLAYTFGEHNISVGELMRDEFIQRNTDFNSWNAFTHAAGVKTERDLGAADFNEFVKSHTRFADWELMLIHASNEYSARREQAEANLFAEENDE